MARSAGGSGALLRAIAALVGLLALCFLAGLALAWGNARLESLAAVPATATPTLPPPPPATATLEPLPSATLVPPPPTLRPSATPRPTATRRPTATFEPGTVTYEIRDGDTLTTIANLFQTSVVALRNANPELDPATLERGDVIRIPSDATVPVTWSPVAVGDTTTYTIQSGDTLATIAARFGTTTSALLALNPGMSIDRILAGDVIVVPLGE